MRITILNGAPGDADPALDQYLTALNLALQADNHQVEQIDLCTLKIDFCRGCFGCWVKTPGECIFHDDSVQVRRSAINSDLLIFASPVKMGFISADLKCTLDKMIPLIHPYLVIDQGELHHRKRYERYPALGLILAKSSDTDAEDMDIIDTSFRRLAINFKTFLHFTRSIDQPVQEVLHEVDRL